jgi:hypothetical protein
MWSAENWAFLHAPHTCLIRSVKCPLGLDPTFENVDLEDKTKVRLVIEDEAALATDEDSTGWKAVDELVGFIKDGPNEPSGGTTTSISTTSDLRRHELPLPALLDQRPRPLSRRHSNQRAVSRALHPRRLFISAVTTAGRWPRELRELAAERAMTAVACRRPASPGGPGVLDRLPTEAGNGTLSRQEARRSPACRMRPR